MDRQTWIATATIILSMIVTVTSAAWWLRGPMATQADIDELRTEIAATRDELRTEIAATRDELRTEIAATRHELRTEIAATRDAADRQMAELRTYLVQHIENHPSND